MPPRARGGGELTMPPRARGGGGPTMPPRAGDGGWVSSATRTLRRRAAPLLCVATGGVMRTGGRRGARVPVSGRPGTAGAAPRTAIGGSARCAAAPAQVGRRCPATVPVMDDGCRAGTGRRWRAAWLSGRRAGDTTDRARPSGGRAGRPDIATAGRRRVAFGSAPRPAVEQGGPTAPRTGLPMNPAAVRLRWRAFVPVEPLPGGAVGVGDRGRERATRDDRQKAPWVAMTGLRGCGFAVGAWRPCRGSGAGSAADGAMARVGVCRMGVAGAMRPVSGWHPADRQGEAVAGPAGPSRDATLRPAAGRPGRRLGRPAAPGPTGRGKPAPVLRRGRVPPAAPEPGGAAAADGRGLAAWRSDAAPVGRETAGRRVPRDGDAGRAGMAGSTGRRAGAGAR
jgi:hypothetical protein